MELRSGVKVDGSAPDEGASPVRTASPPPESAYQTWLRRIILLTFWGVVLVLGLPHWIWTTSIHRSNLPLESMNNWAGGKACQLQYPIHVRLRSDSLVPEQTIVLAAAIESLLQVGQEQSLYKFYVAAANATETSEFAAPIGTGHEDLTFQDSTLIVNVQASKKVKDFQASLKSLTPVLDVQYDPSKSPSDTAMAAFVANEVRKVFADEENTISFLLRNSPYYAYGRTRQLLPEITAVLDAKATRAFKYASTYHLTFSLFTSSGSPSSWKIEEALKESVYPLLEQISTVSDFTVDTQVQLFAAFSPSIAGPQYNPSTREWQLQKSDLSGFINAAEWPLSPSIGSGPTINFVLYVPSRDQSPLVLAETGGSSWIIPQWGGVQILNPTGKLSSLLTAEDLRPAMLTFADQLSSLVGLPQTPPSLTLRISSLTRERATSLILSASSTLGALARLTLKLTSIEIPDSVASSVAQTIHNLDQACQHLHDGRYQTALAHARKAEEEAEKAFFEPSMVGQVYFPEEHKVAVYVPLLGPMAVPLVLSLLKEIKKLRERKAKVA